MTIDDFKKAKIEAMKNHDKDTVTGLNTLINKLMLFNIEKRAKGEEMSEADYVQILKKTQKELVEEKEAFEKAGREDTVRSLENQIAAIEKYLPKMMSEEEIKAYLNKVLEDIQPVKSNKGKIMKLTGSFAPLNRILGSIKYSK